MSLPAYEQGKKFEDAYKNGGDLEKLWKKASHKVHVWEDFAAHVCRIGKPNPDMTAMLMHWLQGLKPTSIAKERPHFGSPFQYIPATHVPCALRKEVFGLTPSSGVQRQLALSSLETEHDWQDQDFASFFGYELSRNLPAFYKYMEHGELQVVTQGSTLLEHELTPELLQDIDKMMFMAGDQLVGRAKQVGEYMQLLGWLPLSYAKHTKQVLMEEVGHKGHKGRQMKM